MIYKKTVFILGAGASQPYGFPTGIELKKLVCDGLVEGKSLFKELKKLEYTDESIKEFRNAFFKSGAKSIDAFLGDRKEDFMSIGKIVITRVLSRYEDEDKIYSKENWYQHLFESMWDGSLEEFENNKVSFINFNYDRSLEHFLFTSLQQRTNETMEKIAKAISKIPIIHPYGKIGFLPWENKNPSRDYYPGHTIETLVESSDMIRIISEGEIPRDILNQSNELITDAYKIVFLGFGYHKENLERIGMKNLNPHNKFILGTARGYTNLQRTTIQKHIAQGKISLDSNNFDVLEFLKNRVEFE